MALAFNSGVGSGTGGTVTNVSSANADLTVANGTTTPVLTVVNAPTADALKTARTIDGQSFNGTANITVVAPATHAASSKATPVDADEMPLADSAASFDLKKLTWANLKATLKTYFDTLYVSSSGAVTSVFGRTGAVVAATNDYTAAQVTNAADKSSSSQQTFSGRYRSTDTSGPVGYAAGAGGAVTQITSRTTAVTINKPTGQITTFNSSMGAGAVFSFTVNNSTVAANNVVLLTCQNDLFTGGSLAAPYVGSVASGSFVIAYTNNSSGSQSTALVFNFVVLQAQAS